MREDKCKLCRRFQTTGRKTRIGYICTECLGRLPRCVAKRPEKLEQYALHDLMEVCRPVTFPEPTGRTSSLGSIIYLPKEEQLKFSGVYIPLSAISKMEFKIVDRNENEARVVVMVYMDTPKVYLMDEAGWVPLPKGHEDDPWWRLIRDMGLNQNGKAKKQYDQDEKARRQQEEWQRRAEEYRERKERERREQQRQHERKQQNSSNGPWVSKEQKQYYDALTLFMLREPYTEADLKRQYRRLQKAFHPDNNEPGSEEYSQKINAAKEILEKKLKEKR